METSHSNVTIENAADIKLSSIALPVEYPEPPTLQEMLTVTDWKKWLIDAGFVEKSGVYSLGDKNVVLKTGTGAAHSGALVAHGPAPYKNEDGAKLSYFVKYTDEKGNVQTAWGQDLQRAIAGFETDQQIELNVVGKEGKANIWEVSRADFNTMFYLDGRPADPCDLIAQGASRADAMALVAAIAEGTPEAQARATAIRSALAERENSLSKQSQIMSTPHDLAVAFAAGAAVKLSESEVKYLIEKKLARPTEKGLTVDHTDRAGRKIGQTTITKSGRIESVCEDDTPARLTGATNAVIVVDNAAQALKLRLVQLKNRGKLNAPGAMPTILIGGQKAAKSEIGSEILRLADPELVVINQSKGQAWDLELGGNKTKAKTVSLDLDGDKEEVEASLRGIHDGFLLAIVACGLVLNRDIDPIVKEIANDGAKAFFQRLDSAGQVSALVIEKVRQKVETVKQSAIDMIPVSQPVVQHPELREEDLRGPGL